MFRGLCLLLWTLESSDTDSDIALRFRRLISCMVVAHRFNPSACEAEAGRCC